MKHIDFENFKLEENKTGGFDIIGSVNNKRRKKMSKKNKPKQPSLRDLVMQSIANDKIIFERLDKIENILERNNLH